MALSLLETTFRERRGGFGTLIEPPCSTRALVFGTGRFFLASSWKDIAPFPSCLTSC